MLYSTRQRTCAKCSNVNSWLYEAGEIARVLLISHDLRHRVNFKWEPNCQLLNFQPHLLASQFLANPLLFVGDSITELQYESLKCLLGEDGEPMEFLLDHKRYSKVFGANGKSAIEFVRSDYLLRLDTWKVQAKGEESGPQLGRGFNVPW
jgi:hypothetical protein